MQVAENLDWGALRRRLRSGLLNCPELRRRNPMRVTTPEGAGVGHLLGYVGSASAKEYEKYKDPLLITPGFKVGKAGIEAELEPLCEVSQVLAELEVTARGKLVRELGTRTDVPGRTVKLTIDAGLQAYAARRLGRESGSVVVIDTLTGGILTLASMPSFDPNAFSDGISKSEWTMLREDDHIPMLNKTLQGLYPPGSTAKPAAALALLRHGVDPEETVSCGGGYRLGNRVFKCLGRHGPMNMPHALMKSCNTYFYAMGRRIGYDKTPKRPVNWALGRNSTFRSSRSATGLFPIAHGRCVPANPGLNGYAECDHWPGFVQVSPFQLACQRRRALRLAAISIPIFPPRNDGPAPPLSFPEEHLAIVREGMQSCCNPVLALP